MPPKRTDDSTAFEERHRDDESIRNDARPVTDDDWATADQDQATRSEDAAAVNDDRVATDDDRATTDEDTAAASEDRTTTDDTLRALGDRRRRVALWTLSDLDDDVTVSELARVMCVDAELRDADESLPSSERLAASLHHVHLPKLAAAGLLSYDPETRRAAATGSHRDCEDCLGFARLMDVLDGLDRTSA